MVIREKNQDDIIVLDYHFAEGFSIYLKMLETHEGNNVYDLNILMDTIFNHIQNLSIDGFYFEFDKGYMFIEKNYYSLPKAIYKARQHALVMAEKKFKVSIMR